MMIAVSIDDDIQGFAQHARFRFRKNPSGETNLFRGCQVGPWFVPRPCLAPCFLSLLPASNLSEKGDDVTATKDSQVKC
jgi:hypothetical protein